MVGAKKDIILITRNFNRPKVRELIDGIHSEVDSIIVLVNLEKEQDHYTQTLLSTLDYEIYNKIDIIHVKPWGDASGALNIGLMKAFNKKQKPKYILITSPEVKIEPKHVKKMKKELSTNGDLLVVGYALEAHGTGHDNKNKCFALKSPWNTCAMWNANLFLKYVGAFNIICDCPNFMGNKLQGMEDALAIKLAQIKNQKLIYKLISVDKPEWDVEESEKEQHCAKITRKSNVFAWYENHILNP